MDIKSELEFEGVDAGIIPQSLLTGAITDVAGGTLHYSSNENVLYFSDGTNAVSHYGFIQALADSCTIDEPLPSDTEILFYDGTKYKNLTPITLTNSTSFTTLTTTASNRAAVTVSEAGSYLVTSECTYSVREDGGTNNNHWVNFTLNGTIYKTTLVLQTAGGRRRRKRFEDVRVLDLAAGDVVRVQQYNSLEGEVENNATSIILERLW